MLSASEIADLERKVAHYRFKRKAHYLVYALLVIVFLGIMVYTYSIFDKKPIIKTNQMDNNVTATLTQLVKPSPTIIPESPVSTSEKILTSEENDINNSVTETLELRLPTIKTPKQQKEENFKPKDFTNTSQEEKNSHKDLILKVPTKIEEPPYYRGNEEKIESTMLAPPALLMDDTVKSKITIETQEINSIQYLKDKFEKTHNIIFALMLAEENYLNKKYDESLKWSLMANSIDAENEKSWLWFAKSKMKLGKQNDAITALESYLKNNKSAAAQSLLNQITMGEFHD
ncbi:MAG: hypothetical protein PHR87_02965 [Sulfurospirillaceae bacterium]|nr:hypothetical protein [Sulfurospirillaceae bacterium]